MNRLSATVTIMFSSLALAAQASSVREQINADATQVLKNAKFVCTNVYEKTPYNVYDTFKVSFSHPTGAGNAWVWAVSPHVLASANHYPQGIRWRWDQKFTAGTNSVTMKKLEWVHLASWALTNGWTKAEIDKMNINDIAFIRCSKATAVPDDCLPYFMTPKQRQRWFGDSMDGVAAWAQCQQYPYARPVVMAGNDKWKEGGAGAEYDAILKKMGTRYVIHVGDSGRPIYIMKNGKPIIVSTFYCEYCGPDYTAGHEVIRKFVESYGDRLKVCED